MYWIIQNNLYNEKGIDELIDLLPRLGVPHSLHKVVPIIGELEPPLAAGITNPILCIGSYSLRHMADKNGWEPGVFDLAEYTYQDYIDRWGQHMLNSEAITVPLMRVLDHFDEFVDDGVVFMRPAHDNKVLAGTLYTRSSIEYTVKGVVMLGADCDRDHLKPDSLMIMGYPKNIAREARLWVVDGKVVTWSQYKIGDRVLYSSEVDQDLIDYAQARVNEWAPARAFVIDIALMRNGSMKVIEVNNLNAAGLYAANVGLLVAAIEDMRYDI